jgi:hypothetical protein
LRALRTDLQHDPTTMHIAPTPPFEGDPTLRWLTRTVRQRGPHVQLTSTLAYSPALRTTLVSEEGPPCEERPESKEEKRAHPWALTTMPGLCQPGGQPGTKLTPLCPGQSKDRGAGHRGTRANGVDRWALTDLLSYSARGQDQRLVAKRRTPQPREAGIRGCRCSRL